MEILYKSRDFSNREIYKMTMDAEIKTVNSLEIGKEIEVDGYLIFNDINSDGNEIRILTFVDLHGQVYATNSNTFINSFDDIYKIMGGEEYSIKILSGETKAGRKFLNCSLV